jgi:hypothetical protein
VMRWLRAYSYAKARQAFVVGRSARTSFVSSVFPSFTIQRVKKREELFRAAKEQVMSSGQWTAVAGNDRRRPALAQYNPASGKPKSFAAAKYAGPFDYTAYQPGFTRGVAGSHSGGSFNSGKTWFAYNSKGS